MLVGGLLLSVSKSSRTLLDPMDCNMAGFPVLHYLPELAQTHVHWVGDAIQPSHPLWSPSPPAFNLSHYQGLFQWVGWLFPSGGQSTGASALVSVLPMNIQGWFPLGLTSLTSLLSKGLYLNRLSFRASLVAQLVKNPPAMWETWVPSLGWEDPLGKRMATHSSILAQGITWTV